MSGANKKEYEFGYSIKNDKGEMLWVHTDNKEVLSAARKFFQNMFIKPKTVEDQNRVFASKAAPTPRVEAPPSGKCPYCGSALWDNRYTKKKNTWPDYRCRNKDCGAAMWLKGGKESWAPPQEKPIVSAQDLQNAPEDDSLPF